MTYFWWLFGVWCVLTVLVAVGMYLRDRRNRPLCPVHDKPMQLVGDDCHKEEFMCYVKGCGWCADVYGGGRKSVFKV